MIAWFVWGADDEWGDYVHGDTRSQAKSMMWREWGLEIGEWIRMRALRCPALDGMPLTSENIIAVNGLYESWYPICKCSLCIAGEGGEN